MATGTVIGLFCGGVVTGLLIAVGYVMWAFRDMM